MSFKTISDMADAVPTPLCSVDSAAQVPAEDADSSRGKAPILLLPSRVAGSLGLSLKQMKQMHEQLPERAECWRTFESLNCACGACLPACRPKLGAQHAGIGREGL